MGTFAGHATPGIFFIIYAIWNAIKQAHDHARLGKHRVSRHPIPYGNQPNSKFGNGTSKYEQSPKFMDSYYYRAQPPSYMIVVHDVAIFPYDKFAEGLFFLLCSIGGGLGVVGYGGWALMDHHGNFSANINNWQHATMFTFFGIYFFIRLLSQTSYRFEPEIEKLFLSLGFFVEAFLFTFHLHGRNDLDIHLHRLLIIAILVSAICLFAQIWKPGDLLLDHIWVVSCLLHGMWFIMTGFVLYNPVEPHTSWAHDEHSSIMMATALYTWQLLLAIVINCVVRWIVYFCVNRTSDRLDQFGRKDNENTTELANLLEDGFEVDSGM